MSLFKKFKERLSQAYDQVNIYDNGRSWQTRTPTYRASTKDQVRDLFDANTQQDRVNRNTRNVAAPNFRPNMSYKEEQEDILGRSNVANNFGESIINPIARSVNTAGNAVVLAGKSIYGLSDIAKESVFGNDKSYQAKLNQHNKSLEEDWLGDTGGLFNAGTHIKNTSELDDPKKMAGTILVTGTDLASFIPAGKAASAGAKGTSTLVKTIAREGTENAVLNAAGNVGEQLVYTGKVDPKQVAIAGATGYALPVATYGAGKVVGGGKNQIVKVLGKDVSKAGDNTKLKVNMPDEYKDPNVPYGEIVKNTPQKSVVQTVNNVTGEKKFYTPADAEYKPLVDSIDNAGTKSKAGVVQKDGSILHVTAKSPEAMQAEGFVKVTKPQELGTVKVQPDGSDMPIQVKSSTNSIGDLLANRKTGPAVNPADEIATKYGGKVADVQRNIDRYGEEATRNMYARKSDALPFNPETGQGIKNIDAVVTAELKKQNPTVKVTKNIEIDEDSFPKPMTEWADQYNGVDPRKVKVNGKKQSVVKVMSPEEEASLYASAPPLEITGVDTPKVKVETPEAKPTVKVTKAPRQADLDEIVEGYDVYDPYVMDNQLPNGKWNVDAEGNILPKDGHIWDSNGDLLALPQKTTKSNPTVKVGNDTVDTVTGEILDTKPKTIVQQIKELPDFDKATLDDMPKIEATTTNMKNAFDEWGKAFSTEERMNYAREVAEYSRNGTPVSERTKQMYNVIKQTLDDMYGRSKSLQGKEATFDMYMPEHRPRIDGEPTPFGSSFVDSMNKEFSAKNKRTFAIDVDEFDDPVNLYKNHVEQWAYDNYGHLKAAENPAYSTFKDPVKYVEGNEAIAKKLAQKTDDEVGNRTGVSRRQAAKSGGILDDLQANYRQNGGEEVIRLDDRLPIGNSTKQHRQVLDDIGVYDVWGFHARDNADDIGSRIFHDKFEADIVDLTPDQLYDRLKAEFGDRLPFDQQTNDTLIRNKQRSIMREIAQNKRMVASGQADSATPSSYHFQQLEKDLATEQIKFFAERSDITDSATKKYLNQRVERALSDNRRRIKIADRVSNEITSTLHAFYLGLKPTSAAQNLTETARTAGIVEPKFWAQAGKDIANPKTAKRVLLEAGEDKNFIKNQSNMPSNYKETPLDKVRSGAMYMFNATESVKDAQMLRALELQGRSKGLSGRELGEYVADTYNKHAFKGGEFGSIKGTDSAIGRPLWQFAQYPVKDIKLNAQYFMKAITGNNAEQRQAIGYLTKTFGTKAAMMAVTYPLFGWGIQQVFGVNPPKAGPITAIPAEIYTAINDENERSQVAGEEMNWQNVLDRVGRKYAGVAIPGGDYLFNKLGVGEALPEGWNPFSKDNVIAEWERGYGENFDGQARIEGAETWYDYGRQLIGGKYNTDAARGYFGATPFSVNINLPGDKFDIDLFSNRNLKPLNAQQQAEFDKLTTKEQKNEYLNRKHGVTKEIYALEDKVYKDPAVKEGYNAMINTAYNPETGKNESDVITPERWKIVQGEKSGELFNLLAEKAKIQNKAFGTPYDPIYDLTDDSQIKEVLALRSAFTGDDRERKATLRKESWYAQYEDQMTKYYENMTEKSGNPDYGPTARAQEYFDLSKNNPAFTVEKPAIIQQYDKIRESGDEEARKAFYRNNADALNAAYTQRSNEQLAWTNKMREIEGAKPISQEVWDNATYGYNDDEMSVAKRIAAENGMYLKDFASGYGKSGSGSYIQSGDFAEIKAAPKPTVSKAKGGTIKVVAKAPRKIKMSRNKA